MSQAQTAEEIKQIVLEIVGSSVLTDGAKCAAIAMALTGAETAREVAAVCNKSVRTMERHYTDAKLLRKSLRQSAEEDTPIGGGGYAKPRTDEPAPVRENNYAGDCNASPTEISNSRSIVTRESTRFERLKEQFNGSTEGMIGLALQALGAGGDRESAEAWLENLAGIKGAEHVQAAYGLWIENKVKNKRALKISGWWSETADTLRRKAEAKDSKPIVAKPTASAQRPAYQIPTRPIYDNREGIALEDALARKLITQEQYDTYSRQVAA